MAQQQNARLWVDMRHPLYSQQAARWEYIEDHYTGEAVSVARAYANNLQRQAMRDSRGAVNDGAERQRPYLWRRAVGESVEAYQERVAISKYPRHMAAIVDSFSGSIFAVADRTARVWADAWGDPEDTGSLIYSILRNADGKGTDWDTHFKRPAGAFTRVGRVWYIVEPELVVWPNILDVLNWREVNGRLVEVLIREHVDTRGSIKDEPDTDERYVLYTLDGFERYRVVENGGKREVEFLEDESGLWEFPHYGTPDRIPGDEILPVGYVELPVEAHLGFMLADGNNHLYNLLSDLRNILRHANFPKLAGDVTDEAFELTQQALAAGSNMLQGNWQYIGPPAENAEVAHRIYEALVREYYVSSFQQYNDAARERTATENKQEDNRGRVSYLTLLSLTLDDLEARIMYLLAQKEFPDEPELWLDSTVKRSRDFKPFDSDAWAARLQARYFGEGSIVPVGPQGQLNAALAIAELDGLEVEEVDVSLEVQRMERERSAGADRATVETQRAQQALENDRQAGEAGMRERRAAIENAA